MWMCVTYVRYHSVNVNQNGVIDVVCCCCIQSRGTFVFLSSFVCLFFCVCVLRLGFLSFALFCFIVCENMMNHCRNYRPYIIQANKNYVALFDCDVRNLTRLLSFIVESEREREWLRAFVGGLPDSFRWIYRLNGHMNCGCMCAFQHPNIYFVKDFSHHVFICVRMYARLCIIFNLNLKKKHFLGPVSCTDSTGCFSEFTIEKKQTFAFERM